MSTCYEGSFWFGRHRGPKYSGNASTDCTEVTCKECIQRMIDHSQDELNAWTARRAEIEEMNDEVPAEFEKVFQENFKDILA